MTCLICSAPRESDARACGACIVAHQHTYYCGVPYNELDTPEPWDDLAASLGCLMMKIPKPGKLSKSKAV